MFLKRVFSLAAALCCLACAIPAAAASEVDCDGVYCFGSGDFSQEPLRGICITGLPEASAGTVMLGERILRPGDVLPAELLDRMTFIPKRTEQDAEVSISYLPVFSRGVGPGTSMTISIRGKENQPPAAEDFAAETYKNLPLEGRLKVKDPEGEAMTFTVTRQPKRGTLELREDGSFTYTPRKNKVGIDSFVYTATDAAGKTSRECTVTVTIVKPTDSTQYTDTVGRECRFAAEWMKNTGIFVGETLDGNACFSPEKAVSQGEFIAMLVRTLDIPTDRAVSAAIPEDTPQWLRPYLAAALRSGITAGLDSGHSQPITGAQAAVMIQNALDLTAAEEAAAFDDDTLSPAQQVLSGYGIVLDSRVLTREQAAQVLYRVSRLAPEAPGMVVIGRQR